MILKKVLELFIFPVGGKGDIIRIQDSFDFKKLYVGHCSSVPSYLLDYVLVNVSPALESCPYSVTFYVR